MGDVYTITHIKKLPKAGNKSRWWVTGTVLGEEQDFTFEVWGDQLSLITAAGYTMKEWGNAPERESIHIFYTVAVIVGKVGKHYEAVKVKDTKTTEGRWISRVRMEQVNVGDTIISKGEGFPRDVVTGIDTAQDGGRRFTFASGKHTSMPPATKIMVLR